MRLLLVIILNTFFILTASAQFSGGADFVNKMDNDLGLSNGGDIFTDFNDDLAERKILEDERFYRYGRFFTFNVGVGSTTFTGNRGAAYLDNNPTYHISFNYFFDFSTSFVIGLEFSKHTMFIDTTTVGFVKPVGAVETNMLRPFFGLRYYLDTANLGTAITYANPYVTGRMEYWYQTNKFIDQKTFEDESGGGIGSGFGFGLEFPIQIKESYLNLEFLYHTVNFFDKWTQNYAQDTDLPVNESAYGYDDMSGDAISIMMNYTLAW